VVGSRAGREKYEELVQTARKVRERAPPGQEGRGWRSRPSDPAIAEGQGHVTDKRDQTADCGPPPSVSGCSAPLTRSRNQGRQITGNTHPDDLSTTAASINHRELAGLCRTYRRGPTLFEGRPDRGVAHGPVTPPRARWLGIAARSLCGGGGVMAGSYDRHDAAWYTRHPFLVPGGRLAVIYAWMGGSRSPPPAGLLARGAMGTADCW